jgi:predicted secreted protein
MSLTFGLAVYFVIWWLALFAVLPFGVRTQDEAGEVVPGTPGSAPAAPRLMRVVLITTLVAAVAFALFYFVYTRKLIRLDDIPIFRR